MENTLEAYKTSNNCYKTFWYIQPESIRNRWAHFLLVFHTNSKIVKEETENKKKKEKVFPFAHPILENFEKPQPILIIWFYCTGKLIIIVPLEVLTNIWSFRNVWVFFM